MSDGMSDMDQEWVSDKDKQIKISNELLSAIFGCDIVKNNLQECKTDHTEGYTLWYISSKDNKEQAHAVNLDTFIRLGIDEWALKEHQVKVICDPFLNEDDEWYYFATLMECKSDKFHILNGEQYIDDSEIDKQKAILISLQCLLELKNGEKNE